MNNRLERFTEVAEAFQCRGHYLGEHGYGSGHINDTFKVCYAVDGAREYYIHQRINQTVFRDVPALMDNIGRVVRHQRTKLEEAGEREIDRRVLTLVPAVDGADYYQDSEGGYWRTYLFIMDAVGIDVVESPEQAYEAAKTFGAFQRQLADLPTRLHETLPGFHDTRSRFNALLRAVEADARNRAAAVRADIDFALAREHMVDTVIDAMAAGDIPERTTHNDTKLNNVLIDTASGKGLCVIDLDTVMPGSVLYDFGDMVRSATTTTAEDEPDLSTVAMDLTCYEALVSGYLDSVRGFLTRAETALLPVSGPLITFETGLRFLTDYLEGDRYFKTRRPEQNRDRCRKQFRMVRSMEEQMDAMTRIVEAAR
jgi:hypothetical protein